MTEEDRLKKLLVLYSSKLMEKIDEIIAWKKATGLARDDNLRELTPDHLRAELARLRQNQKEGIGA